MISLLITQQIFYIKAEGYKYRFPRDRLEEASLFSQQGSQIFIWKEFLRSYFMKYIFYYMVVNDFPGGVLQHS